MKIFIYAIIGIVAVSIVAGFFIVGSPKEARLYKADERRLQDLQSLQWNVVEYWQSKEKLPAKLEDVKDDIRGIIVPKDPETGADYGYTAKGPMTFELCATFARPSRSKEDSLYPSRPMPAYDPYGGYALEENWQHKEGLACFERTIDPDRYPPTKSLKR